MYIICSLQLQSLKNDNAKNMLFVVDDKRYNEAVAVHLRKKRPKFDIFFRLTCNVILSSQNEVSFSAEIKRSRKLGPSGCHVNGTYLGLLAAIHTVS